MTLKLIIVICVSASLSAANPGQTSTQTEKPRQGMGGASTGEAKVYTSRRTVGIIDEKAPVIFEDVTSRTALAKFKHLSGDARMDEIFDALGERHKTIEGLAMKHRIEYSSWTSLFNPRPKAI